MARLGRRQPINRRYPAPPKSPAVAGPYYPTVATDDLSTANNWGAVQSEWDHIKLIDGFVAHADTSIGTISSSLISTGFGFNIDLNRSIAGIVVELMTTFYGVNPLAVTCRLQKTAGVGPRVTFRRQTVTNAFPTLLDYTFGGAADTWDEPYLPSEINKSEFGVAIRLENSTQAATVNIDAVRMTVYSTDQVLPVANYAAGTYSFGPTAVPNGRSLLTFWIDTTLHLDAAVTFSIATEISYDNGSSWAGFIGGSRTGVPGGATHPSGQPDYRFIAYRTLASSGSTTQFRGTFTLTGGSLITGIGVYSS